MKTWTRTTVFLAALLPVGCGAQPESRFESSPPSLGETMPAGDGPVDGPLVESCVAGQARCDGASRERCRGDGSGFDVEEVCGGGRTCVASEGATACRPLVCAPKSRQCATGSSFEVLSCTDDGTTWVSTNCKKGEVCAPEGDSVACLPRICTPHARGCSIDQGSVSVCDATGTQVTYEACAGTKGCASGTCVASQPLGDIVTMRGKQERTLGPGVYTLGVVSTDPADDSDIKLPVKIAAGAEDPVVSEGNGSKANEPRMLPLELGRACGGWDHVLPEMNPMPAPPPLVPGNPPELTIGSERTFHFVPLTKTADGSFLARKGVLRAIGARANYWEDQTDTPAGGAISDDALADVMRRLDEGVMGRDESLLGGVTDVDKNGKIDIVFSSTAVKAGTAAYVMPRTTLFESRFWSTKVDFGEVVYSTGISPTMDSARLAGVLAHEIGHLISYGRRLLPYLSKGPSGMPDHLANNTQNTYLEEGIAEVTQNYSGQSYSFLTAYALENPHELSLARMLSTTYAATTPANLATYGLSALAVEYLFGQAGGVRATSKDALWDLGGRGYFDSLHEGDKGLLRLAPLDGRDAPTWYVDMAAAILAGALDGKLSETARNDARYRFGATKRDADWGGFLGPTLRHEHMPGDKRGSLLRPLPWSSRGETMKRGGIRYVTVRVTKTTTLTIADASSSVVSVRHRQ